MEKHFTYDKNAEGSDHMLSADPIEMKSIVDKVREFEIMKGNGIKRPADCEKTTRINNRKSVVMERSLKQSECITKKDIAIKRPEYGIQPKYFDQILGKKANKNLNKKDVLMLKDLSY